MDISPLITSPRPTPHLLARAGAASSSGDRKSTDLTQVATSTVVPVVIAVIIIAGFVLYKNHHLNEDNEATAESSV